MTTRMPKAERRAQLLGIAREVFTEEGYHAASMDAIAERAGVTKPVLYQHFPSKLELYLALLDDGIASLVDATAAAIASTTDNKQRVHATIDAFFTFVEEHANAFRLVFESDLLNEECVRERVEAAESSIATAIARVIEADTGLAPHEAMLLGAGLQGMLEAAARHWVRQVGLIPRTDAVDQLAALAWRGISGYPIASAQA